MAFILSKSKILSGHQCPRRLYLEVHHPELKEVSDSAEARMQKGNEVGEAARRQFPGGILIEHGDDPGQALVETRRWIRQEGDLTLFEPAFQVGGVYMRADILRRQGGNWELIEVKSSTGVKPYYWIDVATQAWVLDKLALRPVRVMLAHIDNQFVYQGDGDYTGLFMMEDLTDGIDCYQGQLLEWLDAFQAMLAGEEPAISIGPQCNDPFDCPFYDHCDPPMQRPEYPVTLLPRGGKRVAGLLEAGYRDLREVPIERLPEGPHYARIHHCTIHGQPCLDPQAAKELAALAWPRYYLDFETVQFAVPIWAGTRPYQQLPFQWSCHVEHQNGEIEHHAFLDLSGEPPMRGFAESLVEIVAGDGPILAYNASFEQSRLMELVARFPDLAIPLLSIHSRFFDLLPLARSYYYHPAMKGSWSIKAVLPTIAPELAYDNLVIQAGGMASEAYLEAIHPDTCKDRREELRQSLLAYCERDTRGLVELARFFSRSHTIKADELPH